MRTESRGYKYDYTKDGVDTLGGTCPCTQPCHMGSPGPRVVDEIKKESGFNTLLPGREVRSTGAPVPPEQLYAARGRTSRVSARDQGIACWRRPMGV